MDAAWKEWGAIGKTGKIVIFNKADPSKYDTLSSNTADDYVQLFKKYAKN